MTRNASSTTSARAADRRPEPAVDSPRQRLLEVAGKLFYDEGVHVVGIDRVLEESGVAKASLYSHFGSKDGLVREYLEAHFAQRRDAVAKVLEAHDSPRERLVGLFDELTAALKNPAFSGCRFINASAEARPGESIQGVTNAYRTWLRGIFVDLAKKAGASKPKLLGRQLALLYDGAAVAARLDSDRSAAADAARSGAIALIDATIPAGKPSSAGKGRAPQRRSSGAR
jgi:AcrR family transcriptional regulator